MDAAANFGWLLLLVTAGFIFWYKKATHRPDALTSKFEAIKNVDADTEYLLNKVRNALINAGFTRVALDVVQNRFYAQSKFSMASWSEFIEVKITETQNGTMLRFKSICCLPTQIYAWGKNRRNYRKFETELERLLR